MERVIVQVESSSRRIFERGHSNIPRGNPMIFPVSGRKGRIARTFTRHVASILATATAVLATGALAAPAGTDANPGTPGATPQQATANASIISSHAVAFGITPSIRSQMAGVIVQRSFKESEEKNENKRV
ncbi:MAG: hypothetical protein WAR01_07675, partial [Dokdonella sp.]|uniref:hypothetical protein n=1 Tax=Dokdonella sp. TaxID=2291710 RepID=UPI003BB00C42